MKKDNLEALNKQYEEAKAKLPAALAKANQADATLPKQLAYIETVQKRVLEQYRRGETPEPLEEFTANQGARIVLTAALLKHQEWMALSEEVVRIAEEAEPV